MIDAAFPATGAQRCAYAFDPLSLAAVTADLPEPRGGHRIGARLYAMLPIGPGSAAQRIAAHFIGEAARPVRAILFDKAEGNNWALGWHQDRTIAVKAQADVPGFGPWTVKQGIVHVEPPFAIIEAMVTLRLHIDAVDDDNGPLIVAPGSHRHGRVIEADYPRVVDECGSLTCHADAGDIWAYATPILHRSPASVDSARRRRVLQVDYAAMPLPAGLEWADT